jgi:hypothetical protein
MTPSTPQSNTRLAIHNSFTGGRANGTAVSPRVARTTLRTVSRLTGVCSISSQRKSNPRAAACVATSTLFTLITIPMTGWPFFNNSLTGFLLASS